MDGRISGAQPPHGGSTSRLDTLHVVAGHHVEFTIASSQIAGIYVHWLPAPNSASQGCSVLCLGVEDCRWHAQLAAPDWRGYLAVETGRAVAPVLMTLAQASLRLLLAKLPKDAPLRGQRLVAGRNGKGNRGRLYFEDSHQPPHPLPAREVDIWPTLSSLFGPEVYRYHPQHRQEG